MSTPSRPLRPLSDQSVRALPFTETGQKDYADPAIPGFCVRVGKSTKSFRLVVGTGSNRVRYTLGHYPETTLARAREQARDILAQKRLTPTEDPTTPFPEALEQFLDAYRRKNRPSTAAETERLLRRHLAFKNDIRDITTRDLIHTINQIESPSERLHAFVAVKTLFSWFTKQRMLPSSPMAGLDPPHRVQPRERVLTDTELVDLWRSLEKLRDPRFEAICQLLILTGQRLGQIGGLRAEYIDYANRLITWPATEMKGGRAHRLPYADMTATILEQWPKTGLLFPTRAGGTYTSWSTSLEDLRKVCTVPHFVLHDLRRVWATKAVEWNGTAPHIIERVLHHTGGTISGVAAIYQRHHYLPEMRQAMLQFEEKLTDLLKS